MTETPLTDRFTIWANAIDKLGELENLVTQQGDEEERPWMENEGREKFVDLIYNYAHSEEPLITKEDIAENRNGLRERFYKGYRRSLKNDIGDQISRENRDEFLKSYINSEKTLDTLIQLELSDPQHPILQLKMSGDERAIYESYAGIAQAKGLLNAVEKHGAGSLPKEKREQLKNSVALAYADKRRKELEDKYKGTKGIQFYEEMYSASLATALLQDINGEFMRDNIVNGIKRDIKEAEKQYQEVVKEHKGLDIKKVVFDNIKRLADEDTQTYKAMRERLHTAYKISKK